MDPKTTIDQTLATKMNRKRFLIQTGAALLAVVGVGTILQVLTKSTTPHSDGSQRPSAAARSGGGAYGQLTYGS